MANIQAVARLAGVSIATVSRVLKGTAHVNDDVTARVRLPLSMSARGVSLMILLWLASTRCPGRPSVPSH
jgi:Bacterial regulatory proteins, lacI family